MVCGRFSLSTGTPVAGFHHTDHFLAGRVASFVTEGLTGGGHVIVLATASHWPIAGRLADTGLAFRAVSEGQLLMLDATDVLDGLTVDHRVSVEGFRAALTRFIIPAARQRSTASSCRCLPDADNV
jgi:hypothetical protein